PLRFSSDLSLTWTTFLVCSLLLIPPIPSSLFHACSTPRDTPVSLHDALPISPANRTSMPTLTGTLPSLNQVLTQPMARRSGSLRSEEHTSELQSRENLVCRLLLVKRKKVPTRATQIDYSSDRSSHSLAPWGMC